MAILNISFCIFVCSEKRHSHIHALSENTHAKWQQGDICTYHLVSLFVPKIATVISTHFLGPPRERGSHHLAPWWNMEYKSDEKEDKNFITKIWTSRGKITDVSREGDSQEGKKVETWSRNLFSPRLSGWRGVLQRSPRLRWDPPSSPAMKQIGWVIKIKEYIAHIVNSHWIFWHCWGTLFWGILTLLFRCCHRWRWIIVSI